MFALSTTRLGPECQPEIAVGEGAAPIEADGAQSLDLGCQISSTRSECAAESEENNEAIANGFTATFR